MSKTSGRNGRRGTLSALVAIGSRAISQVILIVVTLVATRYLSPADFGVFAIATAFVVLARTLLYMGPYEYLLKAKKLDDSAAECLTATILMALLTSALLLLLAVISPIIFSTSNVAIFLIALAPSNIICAFASWQEVLLLRQGRTRTFYITSILVELAGALVAIVMLASGYNLWALVAQTYVRLVVTVAIYAFVIDLPAIRLPLLAAVRDVIRWSSTRYAATLVSFVSNYSGDLVLGALLTPAATGTFRAGNRIVTAAGDLFAQPARLFATTAFSRQIAVGQAHRGSWIEMILSIAFLGWPALIGVAMLGDWLALVALGPQWGQAGIVITLVSLARLTSIPSAVLIALLVAHDEVRRLFIQQVIGALVVVALTVTLSPWGVVGAATASLVVAVGSTIWTGLLAVNHAPIGSAEWRRLLPALLVPAAFTAAGTLVGREVAVHIASSTIARLAIATGFGAICWLLATLCFQRKISSALGTLTADEFTQAKTTAD